MGRAENTYGCFPVSGQIMQICCLDVCPGEGAWHWVAMGIRLVIAGGLLYDGFVADKINGACSAS